MQASRSTSCIRPARPFRPVVRQADSPNRTPDQTQSVICRRNFALTYLTETRERLTLLNVSVNNSSAWPVTRGSPTNVRDAGLALTTRHFCGFLERTYPNGPA